MNKNDLLEQMATALEDAQDELITAAAIAKKSKPNQNIGYVLRTCTKDMGPTGSGAEPFRWPYPNEDLGHGLGVAVCPDWDPTPECGHGLHGLLHGEGDFNMLAKDLEGAVWLVVEVQLAECVNLKGKVKFPRGKVIFAGNRQGAGEMISKLCPGHAPHFGISIAGYKGIAMAGDNGIATAGYKGITTVGEHGVATADYMGVATAGEYGVATAGEYGIATASNYGAATAGDWGVATAGDWGAATTGEYGTIILKFWNSKRYITKAFNVGEDGVEPNVAYELDEKGELQKKV